ncbi:MAG: hypothetical protein LBU86_06415, partial [Oscillospiraceae bacterium]|nr:hypothetical protein [Oscillospiraceae bacterium]
KAGYLQREKRALLDRHRGLSAKAYGILKEKEDVLFRLKESPALRSPKNALIKSGQALDIYVKSMYNSKRIFIHAADRRVSMAAALLDSLSPLRVLDRGYCLARRDGSVAAAETLEPGDGVELFFADGSAEAEVLSVKREKWL